MLLVAITFAAALAIASFVASLEVVQSFRRRPTPLALPVAFAALVFYEALALPALSVASWVTATGAVAVQVPLLALGALAARKRLTAGRRYGFPRLATWALLPIAGLGVLLAASAVEYPPNTWDAMTYHLARVAHWIANESVAAYPSWSPRQNEFVPGAAYLLLLPQVVADSDRLASLVQFACWVLLVVAAPSWARLFGAPRRIAPLAALFVATAPMALLQASSTQYDLVASVVALAIAVPSVSLVRSTRPCLRELALLGVAVAAAWLVKSTAVVAALPFLAWAAVRQLRRARAHGFKLVASSALIVVAPLALAFTVESLRRAELARSLEVEATLYVYPMAGEWLDRLANSVRGAAHHLPIAPVLARLSPALGPAAGDGVGRGPELFRPHEDYVGNPVQAASFLAACAVLILRRRVPPRIRASVACAVAAWVLLHALARDNAWISRLQVPIFVLAAPAVGAFGPLHGRTARWFTVGVTSLAIAYAASVAIRNETRPPRLYMPDPMVARYVNLPELRALDDAALSVAAAAHCTRLGVRLTPPPGLGDPWDYPLLWRARAAGIEARHVDGDDPWPCVLQSLTHPPPGAWVWSGSGLAYVRLPSP